ncbi:MAG: tetratricopeptide repeat protein [Pseudomonadota bacterium]|nr:tetratricopeptide repeat protein [Pseudomonadota bacterium]
MTTLLKAAKEFHSAGKFSEARAAYTSIIEETPDNAEVLYLLGTLLAQQGDFARAKSFLLRALKLLPKNSIYHCNIGVVEQNLGNYGAAMKSYQNAIRYDSQNIEAYYNSAKLFKQLGHLEKAIANYEQVLSIDPTRTDAHINLGNILNDLGRYENAIAYFKKATQVGNDSKAFINLGNTYRRMGCSDLAIQSYDASLLIEYHDGLEVKKALTLPVVYKGANHLLGERNKLTARVEELSKGKIRLCDPPLEVSSTNFFLAYQNFNNRTLHSKIADIYISSCEGLDQQMINHDLRGNRGSKIKIGFLSNYFRNHSVGRMMLGFIRNLPRDIFDISLITWRGQRDHISKLIENVCSDTLYLPESIFDAQSAIALKQLDVLFYCEIGMDIRTYFLAFSRLAPLQCVGWGHPDTTGIPNIDVFISSSLIEPTDAEGHYTESLKQFSNLPTYYERPETPAVFKTKSDFGLSDKGTVYLCAQSAIKFHPDIDKIFSSILSGDDKAIIVVLEGAISYWTELLLERWHDSLGKHIDRVLILPRQSPENFICLLKLADVILDTPHFSGGNTSFEGFALGKAIVTLDSKYMRGRVTAGMYRSMKFADCIATSIEEYSSIALNLGLNLDFRRDIEELVIERNDILFEKSEFITEFVEFARSNVPV